MDIRITKTTAPKAKPQKGEKLGFGHIFTDHMFLMNYTEGKGWHDARIEPYANISLAPSAMVFHYGQEMFEGLKAYRGADDSIYLFRPDMNAKRANASNERLCIPEIPEDMFVDAVKALVDIDRDWVPSDEGTSLYIRPFIFAVDPHLGVHAAKHLLFVIILSPVGAYYPQGLNPVKIYVENNYVRAVKGGMGAAKTGGNYAAGLKAQDDADKAGYAQVLWLDGVERKYIEEVGAMNVFFVLDGEVVTPDFQGAILSGITRMSCIEIMKSWGMNVSERRLSIDELAQAYDEGRLLEAFGSGTAAVISPIGELKWGDKIMTINNGEIGAVSQKLYDTLTGIQWGKIEGPEGWSVKI